MFAKLRSLILVTPLLAMTACSIQPGDYVVYRVAFDGPQNGLNCSAGLDPDPNQVDDSSDLTTASSIAIFAFDDTYFLEFGGNGMGGVTSLEGDRDGKSYSFSASTVDVQVINPDDDTTTTHTIDIDIDLTIDGKSISGVATTTDGTTCSGPSCLDGLSYECTTTQKLRGSEVKDADLERMI